MDSWDAQILAIVLDMWFPVFPNRVGSFVIPSVLSIHARYRYKATTMSSECKRERIIYLWLLGPRLYFL